MFFKLTFVRTVAVFIGIIVVSQLALAASFVGSDDVYINYRVFDDLYAAGTVVNIVEDIEGDAVIAGGTVFLRGNVKGDVIVAGGKVQIDGRVGDDVRAAGGQITISGDVQGDVVGLGGSIEIDPEAIIKGEVFSLGGIITMYGKVLGDMRLTGGRVIIGGTIDGDTIIRTQGALLVTNSANLKGDLVYFSPIPVEVREGTVQGRISFNKIEKMDFRKLTDTLRGAFAQGYLITKLWGYIALLLVGLLFVFIYPNLLAEFPHKVRENLWKTLGVGAVTLLLIPIISFVLLFSVVGVPLALILLGGLAIISYIAFLFAGMLVGSLFFKKLKKPSKKQIFGILALGIFLFKAISAIPIIGWLLGTIVWLLALGGLVLIKKDMILYLSSKKIV